MALDKKKKPGSTPAGRSAAEPLPRPKTGTDAAVRQRLQALHPAHAHAGPLLARRALRHRRHPRAGRHRRAARRPEDGATRRLPRGPREGRHGGAGDEGRHLRDALHRRSGRRREDARQRRFPARPAARRDVHGARHPAHARGLLLATRVRRQHRHAGVAASRSRGRRAAARLLRLLDHRERLRRAGRPSDVDREPRRSSAPAAWYSRSRSPPIPGRSRWTSRPSRTSPSATPARNRSERWLAAPAGRPRQQEARPLRRVHHR